MRDCPGQELSFQQGTIEIGYKLSVIRTRRPVEIVIVTSIIAKNVPPPSTEIIMTQYLLKLSFVFLIGLSSFVAASPAGAQPLGPDFADIVERADPAVVNIRTIERVRSSRAQGGAGPQSEDPMEMFRWFFGPNVPRPQQPNPRGPRRGEGDEIPRGVGSGFFITADGYILTNHHVVDGADEIIVTLTDKRELKARVVGSDQRTDVALIKVEGNGFRALPLGDPSKLRKGEWVIAIGSPFGLESTVTAGVVSAKGRDTGDFLPFIQTDVAVNPGNSGGPLINMRGEVVGINSQIFTRSGGYQGISFAIPIDEATRVSDQLRTTGRVSRGKIGINIDEVTKDVAEGLGLAKPQGALVTGVEAGSPAGKAGIEPGDIVLKFDGRVIDKSSELPRLAGNSKPGSKITLQVWRRGQTRDVTVTLAEFENQQTARAPSRSEPSKPPADAKPNELGLVLSDLTAAKREELKVRNGVQVDAVDGVAARAGLRPGDIILGFNNQEITSTKQFAEVLAKADLKRASVLLVKRGETVNYVPLRPAR
jgi:serine protease Do